MCCGLNLIKTEGIDGLYLDCAFALAAVTMIENRMSAFFIVVGINTNVNYIPPKNVIYFF